MNENLEKRLKRQVLGKFQDFVAVVPLGFENTLVSELQHIGITTEENLPPKILADGKVHWRSKLTEAWKAVAYSRIANRILMQVASFNAENFGKLEKEIQKIPWELYLPTLAETQPQNFHFHVTSKHSRLYHSDAILERSRPIIMDTLTNIANFSPDQDREPSQQNIYLNFVDDHCTVFVDLAGEELYKRGHQRFVAEAPLKETLAAAMIFETTKNLAPKRQQQTTIIDPMAGSGTFSLEAAYIHNRLIPGVCRNFALMEQPAFKSQTWNFILKQREVAVAKCQTEEPTPDALSLITSDISPRSIEIINHNVEVSPLPKGIIKPSQKDFFDYDFSKFTAGSTILLNPPYGKRLNVDAPKLYKEIGLKLKEAKDCNIAILVPKGECFQQLLMANKTFENSAYEIKTSHGGFSLSLLVRTCDRKQC